MRLVRPRTVAASTQWPNLGNTGVPSGTTLTPNPGSFTTTSSGMHVTNLDITGAFVVEHTNLLVERCRITIDNPGTDIAALFFTTQPHGGTVEFRDCEFDCQQKGGTSGVQYDNNTDPPTVTLRRCQIRRTENGMGPLSHFRIYDSLIYNLDPDGSDPHTDGLQTSPDVSDVIIEHNVFDMSIDSRIGTNSCIQFDVNAPSNFDWLVNNNKLLLHPVKGGACLRIPNGNATANNIRVTNNRLMPGVFSYHIPGDDPETHITEWSGNVNDTTGAAVN